MENNNNEVDKSFAKKYFVFVICQTILMSLTFMLILIIMFTPCFEINGATCYTNYMTTYKKMYENEDLLKKYQENEVKYFTKTKHNTYDLLIKSFLNIDDLEYIKNPEDINNIYDESNKTEIFEEFNQKLFLAKQLCAELPTAAYMANIPNDEDFYAIVAQNATKYEDLKCSYSYIGLMKLIFSGKPNLFANASGDFTSFGFMGAIGFSLLFVTAVIYIYCLIMLITYITKLLNTKRYALKWLECTRKDKKSRLDSSFTGGLIFYILLIALCWISTWFFILPYGPTAMFFMSIKLTPLFYTCSILELVIFVISICVFIYKRKNLYV